MLFRRHSRGENSRVGQVLVAWFRDFGRASRPWLRRARRRDSWRSLRLTKVAGLHDANAKSLWNLLTRENAARIRKEDRSRSRSFSEKNFDPDSVGSETKINGETRETRGWLWKGRTGDESSGSLCPAFGAVKRAGNVVNFAHIHFDLLKIDLYGMNGTKLLRFFFFCSSCKYLLCIFRWW